MQWRALDREGQDKCRLARTQGGWMLVGHARFRDGQGWAALDYVVRLDEEWRSLGADVSGEHGGETVGWRLARENGGWTLNGAALPGLEAAIDVDLSFTPATNTMPLRRLPEVGRLDCTAAWLRLPGPEVTPLSQSYTRERGGLVRYAAEQSGFQTHLAVDAQGFVTLYPGLWERVDHG
jgi:hypothetical protein